MYMKNITPNPTYDLQRFVKFLLEKNNFSFIRFSDGETEILRNRYLEIGRDKIYFQGKSFPNIYPEYDSKKFDPRFDHNIRKDLMSSALFRHPNFYKGVPTAHNNAIKDREFLLRLNGGFDYNMTFADLFLNSNYKRYRNELVPLFQTFENLYLIANFRSKPTGFISKACLIPIPDNFFMNYNATLDSVFSKIKNVESGSLILSSASSLSKILGYKLFQSRQDVTFLDIGTSINYLLTLNHNTRSYHKLEKSFLHRFIYKTSKGYRIKW